MTSANVIEYDIHKDDKRVGYFRKNMLCRLPEFSDLLKYEPLKEHMILEYYYDEEEELQEAEPQNLEDFLRGMIRFNKAITEYFKNLDTK